MARDAYRSDELGDLAERIGRATLGVGKAQQGEEALEAPTFRKFLVALDGSAGSRPALSWAALLGRKLGAHVTAVSVAPSRQAAEALRSNAAAWDAVSAAFGESEEQAAKVLAQAARRLSDAGVAHATELREGAAAAAIVGLAAELDADLVILGSHGHGLGERLNLGSVGSSVKHHVAGSVLIARTAPPPKRVLLGTDGSQRSRVAADAGLALARALGARATLAHVVDSSAFGLGVAAGLLRGRLAAVAGRDEPSARVTAGPPAARLRSMAKQERADLIVVGSRGLGGLRSLALGSVSDRLSHKAQQSVLVVKPRAVA